MIAILKKEVSSFFTSAIGYLVIALFLVITGLFLWFFEGQFNIPNSGFADLAPFFQLAPWIFLLLIPAITMRSLSDEQKQGTLELLLTKPITTLQLTLGKYLGAFLLIIIALAPTLIYVIAIYQLGNPTGNLDTGVTIGSYIGLLFLSGVYTSIGIYTSSLTDNQIVAFISAVFICFLLYYGLEGIANYHFLGSGDRIIENLGIQSHYESISRGVIDSRDLVYFISLTAFLLFLTVRRLQRQQYKKEKSVFVKVFKTTPSILIGLLVLIMINLIASTIHKRYDLTQDQRYSLSDPTKDILDQINSPLIIDVFLEGTFPSEFKKLQNETQYLLEEMQAYNPKILFAFSNPVEEGQNPAEVSAQFNSFGMNTIPLKVKSDGQETTQTIFPWATINYNDKAIPVSLVKNVAGSSPEQLVYSSIQNLEYAFAEGFNRSVNAKSKRIAVLRDNGELPDAKIADMFRKLGETYSIAPFPMNVANQDPSKALNALQNTFDLVVIAKPTKPFTEKQKYVIDQYILNGGNTLWMLDAVIMEDDSLRNDTSKAIAFERDLNLNDQFFNYGVRINPALVVDLYSAPLSVAAGDGSSSQYVQLPWFYRPQVPGLNTHPINTNIERPVKFNYASPIELLKNTPSIDQTVLLTSSILTKIEAVPREISLAQVDQEPIEGDFNAGNQPLAVLLEGNFESAFKNRVLPSGVHKDSFRESATKPSKFILISDGDIIANEIDRKGNPLELGFDYYTRTGYGNKEFLLNAVNYLLDDTGLINIRTKEIALPFLDGKKTAQNLSTWKVLTMAVPLTILIIFGVIYGWIRKRKFAH
ncbi:gliding motility-associated ABC transporter substrate-binding protein GldG [Dokdonia sp. Hel_I_53]|uniref:gliding motility-associated ABC transporter substrate-binding protein GldG n=1 Tax=Dokdonia sp. Hel_I_53 TaxID=1566287 RepID=UPI00119C3070|nr:gliding motility-associated ABC transporter substrate-binding protein GldG [Dokdonia sp. Hel_I_53]TVZ51011.1 ABC-2 type transport system permease protein [Dokdonia sp. Hel_I_53]